MQMVDSDMSIECMIGKDNNFCGDMQAHTEVRAVYPDY